MRTPIEHSTVDSRDPGTWAPAATCIGDRHWTWGPFGAPAERRAANRRYAAVDG